MKNKLFQVFNIKKFCRFAQLSEPCWDVVSSHPTWWQQSAAMKTAEVIKSDKNWQ